MTLSALRLQADGVRRIAPTTSGNCWPWPAVGWPTRSIGRIAVALCADAKHIKGYYDRVSGHARCFPRPRRGKGGQQICTAEWCILRLSRNVVGIASVTRCQAPVAPIPATRRATAMRPIVVVTHLPQAAHAVPTCGRRHAPENAIVAVKEWRTYGTHIRGVCPSSHHAPQAARNGLWQSGVPPARSISATDWLTDMRGSSHRAGGTTLSIAWFAELAERARNSDL